MVETSRPSLPVRNSSNKPFSRGNRFGAHGALRHKSAELFPSRFQILDLGAVLRRTIEGRVCNLGVADRNVEPLPKLPQLVFVQFFLLVGDVLSFARFAEAVTLNRARKDNGGAALVLESRFVGGVNFSRIVATLAHGAESFVGVILDHFQEARISPENVLADVCAGLHGKLLRFAVHHFSEALDEKAINILLKERIPIRSPEDLNAIPTGATECGFEFLNDLSIAADGAIQPLKVAVDNENKIVEFFAGGKRDGSQCFRLVRFAVAEERPNFSARNRLHAAIFEIAAEASLIDRHDRAKTHRNRRKLPEIRHQPRVWI